MRVAAPRRRGRALDDDADVLLELANGAREGTPFIRSHMIRTTDRAFDDFAASGVDAARNRFVLGLDDE